MRLFCLILFFCLAAISVFETELKVLGAESEADIKFTAQNFAVALEYYNQEREQTQKTNQRDEWKRITVQIVRCCLALGEMERAVQEYFLLCRVEISPPLDCIPLPWFIPSETMGSVGMKPSEKTAEDYLDPLQTTQQQKKCLAAKLLAAGTLLASLDSVKQRRGIQLLRDLELLLEQKGEEPTTEETTSIALLAATLRWKQWILVLQKKSELVPFQRILERIPEPLKAGPLFLYGRAAQQVGDWETSVLAFMRIPILYPQQTFLVAESLRAAADSLDKLGRPDQANALRAEAAQKTY